MIHLISAHTQSHVTTMTLSPRYLDIQAMSTSPWDTLNLKYELPDIRWDPVPRGNHDNVPRNQVLGLKDILSPISEIISTFQISISISYISILVVDLLSRNRK